jgi:hypothetical protein
LLQLQSLCHQNSSFKARQTNGPEIAAVGRSPAVSASRRPCAVNGSRHRQ